MRKIKIKTKRFKRWSAKTANSKLESLADYSGSGDNVRDYMVAERDGDVIGCGSLHVMWSDLAEIRSVALRNEFMGRGIGTTIVEALLEEAKTLGIEKVFVLTYKVEFFKHRGFSIIDKSELPHKIWNECINCVHFPNCDEIAMIRPLK